MSAKQTTGASVRRTTTQLQKAMGISADQLARACSAELVPPPDMKTPRWSGLLVDDLVARRGEILDGLPDDLDNTQLHEALGMNWGDWKRAQEVGCFPRRTGAPVAARSHLDPVDEQTPVFEVVDVLGHDQKRQILA